MTAATVCTAESIACGPHILITCHVIMARQRAGGVLQYEDRLNSAVAVMVASFSNSLMRIIQSNMPAEESVNNTTQM